MNPKKKFTKQLQNKFIILRKLKIVAKIVEFISSKEYHTSNFEPCQKFNHHALCFLVKPMCVTTEFYPPRQLGQALYSILYRNQQIGKSTKSMTARRVAGARPEPSTNLNEFCLARNSISTGKCLLFIKITWKYQEKKSEMTPKIAYSNYVQHENLSNSIQVDFETFHATISKKFHFFQTFEMKVSISVRG